MRKLSAYGPSLIVLATVIVVLKAGPAAVWQLTHTYDRARIVQAAYLKSPGDGSSRSAWRLHTHFDVERGLPQRIDVTGANNSGASDERAVLRQHLESDRCYVLDRG